jgi:hypothetical protein
MPDPLNMKTEHAADKAQREWWYEVDADGCWHIGTGDRGFADLGEGSEAQCQSKIITDAHNAQIAAVVKETGKALVDRNDRLVAHIAVLVAAQQPLRELLLEIRELMPDATMKDLKDRIDKLANVKEGKDS